MTPIISHPDLAANPDRARWNDRYRQSAAAHSSLTAPAGMLDEMLRLTPPAGPVLELAGGPSGTALALAENGRHVTVVDISDTALALLETAAVRRQTAHRLTLVHADLTRWKPDSAAYAIVFCRYFWDPTVFHRACHWVTEGGLLAWEAPALIDGYPAHGHPRWCLRPGQPAELLPDGFDLLHCCDLLREDGPARQMIATRTCTHPRGRA
ncbi:class I SAM-dependent methyltransferase [Streptomyces sp. NPDC047028]|uniref:SAM-dependent methyltransferase n=1 Tax=Streptomyces sp. NPDC047028 TaxID=3155793 RepID=UPI00340FB24B